MGKWHTKADIQAAVEANSRLTWAEPEFDYLKRIGAVPAAAPPPVDSGLGRWAYPPGALEQTVRALVIRQCGGERDPGRTLALLAHERLRPVPEAAREECLADLQELSEITARFTNGLSRVRQRLGLPGVADYAARTRRPTSFPRIGRIPLARRASGMAASLSLFFEDKEPELTQRADLERVTGTRNAEGPVNEESVPLNHLASLSRLQDALVRCSDTELLAALADTGWVLKQWDLISAGFSYARRRPDEGFESRFRLPEPTVGLLTAFIVNVRRNEPLAARNLEHLITELTPKLNALRQSLSSRESRPGAA